MSTLPPPSPELDHQVSATFQAGYRFKGVLVRPARVQVYAGKTAQEDANTPMPVRFSARHWPSR